MAYGFCGLSDILSLLERTGVPKAFATNVFASLFQAHLPKISNPCIHGAIIRGYKMSEAARDPFAPFMVLWYHRSPVPPPRDMFFVDFELAASSSTTSSIFLLPRDPAAVFGEEVWTTLRDRAPPQDVSEDIKDGGAPHLARRDKCNVCGVPRSSENQLKCCGKCKRVYYCSRQCQLRHWPEHKHMCLFMTPPAPPSSPAPPLSVPASSSSLTHFSC